MTVASEQWVMVGVISTTTVLMDESGEVGGRMWMSGKFTTASDPSERGCSGSEIVEMRSVMQAVSGGGWVLQKGQARGRTIDLLLVYVLDSIVVRVARRDGLVEGIAQVVVAGDQRIEQATAAVLTLRRGRRAAARGQVGGIQDGRIRVVLVVHGW